MTELEVNEEIKCLNNIIKNGTEFLESLDKMSPETLTWIDHFGKLCDFDLHRTIDSVSEVMRKSRILLQEKCDSVTLNCKI